MKAGPVGPLKIIGEWQLVPEGYPVSFLELFLAAAFFVLIVFGSFALTRMKAGADFMAVLDSPELHSGLGYDTRKSLGVAMFVAGALGGAGGFVAVLDASVVPASATGYAIVGVSVSLLSSSFGLLAVVVAGFSIALVETILGYNGLGGVRDVVPVLALATFLVAVRLRARVFDR